MRRKGGEEGEKQNNNNNIDDIDEGELGCAALSARTLTPISQTHRWVQPPSNAIFLKDWVPFDARLRLIFCVHNLSLILTYRLQA